MAMCMACQKRICQNCATVWDGINYCVDCLAERRRGEGVTGRWGAWARLLLSLPVLYVLVHGLRLVLARFLGVFS
jgi:hypothetical protein